MPKVYVKVIARRAGSIVAIATAISSAAFAQDGVASADQGERTQQEAESGASTVRLEDIVVTATRSTTRLQDTPLAVTAVTASGLQERAFTSVQDVAAIVPNASFQQGNASFGRTLQAYIRGIGQNDFSLAFEPGVAVYVDDQYYALSAGSIFDLLDLERVEILRGPQGTVFGRNAIGGAVNLIAKPPSAQFEGYVQATYGAYNRQDIRVGLNAPISDHLYVRFSGLSKNRRGYQRLLDFRCEMTRLGAPGLAGNFPSLDASNGYPRGANSNDCTLGRYGGEDVQAMRGALRWDSPGIDITVSADYTDDQSPTVADTQLRIVQTPASINLDNLVYRPLWGISYDQRFITNDPFTTYATYADPIPTGTNIPGTYYNGSALRGGVNLDRTMGMRNYGFGVKGIFDLTSRVALTVLGSYRNVVTGAMNDSDGSPINLQTTKSVITFDSWTFEPRLNFSSPLADVTVGAFYYKGDGRTTVSNSAPLLNLQLNQVTTVNSESKAVYAQAVVRPIGEALSLTLGGRYSDDIKNASYDNGSFKQTTPLGQKRWDYRFSADYKITPDVTFYGSVASGYRPGAFNPRPFQATQLQATAAEELVTYELGLKSDLFDRRVRLNIAGFYSDYKTRIVSQSGSECLNNGTQGVCNVAGLQVDPAVTGGSALCRNYNAATDGPVNLSRGIGVQCISRTNYINSPGKIKGLEVELEARPVDGLLFNLSGGYTKFDAPELRNDPLVVNTTPTYVPEWTGSAGLAYDVLVDAINGQITPRIDVFYQSAISFNARSNFAQIPGRALVNGRITYTDAAKDWTVAVGATNLFDKRYYYNLFDLVPFGQVGTEGQPGRPREWYMTVTRRF